VFSTHLALETVFSRLRGDFHPAVQIVLKIAIGKRLLHVSEIFIRSEPLVRCAIACTPLPRLPWSEADDRPLWHVLEQ